MIYQVTHTVTHLVEAKNSDEAREIFYDRAREIIQNPERISLQVVAMGALLNETR